jgi:antitoxin component YwqK of YwqJK toxin-antitoxin module
MELSFKNNKLEGVSKEYYENGALKTTWSYKDGKREGITVHSFDEEDFKKLGCQWEEP